MEQHRREVMDHLAAESREGARHFQAQAEKLQALNKKFLPGKVLEKVEAERQRTRDMKRKAGSLTGVQLQKIEESHRRRLDRILDGAKINVEKWRAIAESFEPIAHHGGRFHLLEPRFRLLEEEEALPRLTPVDEPDQIRRTFEPPFLDGPFFADFTDVWGFGYGRSQPYGRESQAYFPEGGFPNAAFIRNGEHLYIHGAGDWDTAWVDHWQGYGMGLRMPFAGKINVVLEMRTAQNHSRIGLVDEWGISWGRTRQQHAVAALVFSSDPQSAPESARLQGHNVFETDLSTDVNILPNPNAYQQILPTGDTRFFEFDVDGVFAADALLRLEFGSLNHIRCFANDVSISSELLFEWRVLRAIVTFDRE